MSTLDCFSKMLVPMWLLPVAFVQAAAGNGEGQLDWSLEEYVPPALSDIVAFRTVRDAFRDLTTKVGYRLCYEDVLMAPAIYTDPSDGIGVAVDVQRVMPLSQLEVTDLSLTAEAVLAMHDTVDPLTQFELRDVGGCLTAVAVARRELPIGVWEQVTPVLDTSIDVASADTFRGVLTALETGMDNAGIPTTLFVPTRGVTGDPPCPLVAGTYVARDVIGIALQCSPWNNELVYSFLTDGSALGWGLNMFSVGNLE